MTRYRSSLSSPIGSANVTGPLNQNCLAWLRANLALGTDAGQLPEAPAFKLLNACAWDLRRGPGSELQGPRYYYYIPYNFPRRETRYEARVDGIYRVPGNKNWNKEAEDWQFPHFTLAQLVLK